MIVDKYNETPLGGIREHIRDRLLDDADRKMRHAYRSRDKFMAAVWRMDRLHQDAKKRDPQGRPKCACGELVDKCKERAALAPIVSALDQWEKHEVERLEKGLDHGLPENHPKVLARPRRWA